MSKNLLTILILMLTLCISDFYMWLQSFVFTLGTRQCHYLHQLVVILSLFYSILIKSLILFKTEIQQIVSYKK